MELSLTNYLSGRLETQLRSLDLDWLGFFVVNSVDSSLILKSQAGNYTRTRSLSMHPVVFGDRKIGEIHAASHSFEAFNNPKLAENLQALASQFAAVWSAPAREKAMQFDREMERLQKENRSYDWCGIYVVRETTLYLEAFRGPATPHMIIPKNEGICGAAVRENQTLNIADVAADPRYLSCDTRTKSELVVPIRNRAGDAIAEIDIDSHQSNAFTSVDVEKVEKLARSLADMLN